MKVGKHLYSPIFKFLNFCNLMVHSMCPSLLNETTLNSEHATRKIWNACRHAASASCFVRIIEVPIDLLKKHHSLIHNQVVSTIETLLYVAKQRCTKAWDAYRYPRDLWTIKDISKQKTKPAFKMQNLRVQWRIQVGHGCACSRGALTEEKQFHKLEVW